MKVRKLIAKLGGVPAVAKKLTEMTGKPVSAGTVYRWRDRETISYRWRPYVVLMLTARKMPVPAELLPQIETQAAE